MLENKQNTAHKTPRARFKKVGIDRAENIVKAIVKLFIFSPWSREITELLF